MLLFDKERISMNVGEVPPLHVHSLLGLPSHRTVCTLLVLADLAHPAVVVLQVGVVLLLLDVLPRVLLVCYALSLERVLL